jgi:hypothetical protein
MAGAHTEAAASTKAVIQRRPLPAAEKRHGLAPLPEVVIAM